MGMTDNLGIKAVVRRAKEIFARANLKERVWGDFVVRRVPGSNTPMSLSDEEQEAFLRQAYNELLAEQT